MSEWHPIRTCPRDGKWRPVRRYMDPFGWVEGEAYWIGELGGHWISRGSGPFGNLGLAHPTQWRESAWDAVIADWAARCDSGEFGRPEPLP